MPIPAALATLALPTKVVSAPWLVAVPGAPLAAALLVLLFVRRQGPRWSGLVAGLAGLLGAAACAGALLATSGSAERPRLAVARGLALLDSGALVVDSSLALDPSSALLAFVVCVALAVAGLVAFRRGDAPDWGAACTLAGGVLLAIAADDLAFSLVGWELAGLAAWRLGSTGSAVVMRFAVASALLAGLLLFWSMGATQRSGEGRLVRDVSLARLVGVPAAFEIGARRGQPVPVGVEESMRLGDRTASQASWLVAGPTLSRRHQRDLLMVESTGLFARLEAQRLGEVPVLLLFAVLVLFAAALTCVLVPVRVAPPLALVLLPLLGAGLLLRFDFLLESRPLARFAAPLVVGACLSIAAVSALRSLRRWRERRQPPLVDAAGALWDALGRAGPALGGVVLSFDRGILEEGPGRLLHHVRRLWRRERGS